MRIENRIAYADPNKALYKKGAYIGSEYQLNVTFFSPEGERLELPRWEDETYLEERFDVSKLTNAKIEEAKEYGNGNDLNKIIINDKEIICKKDDRLYLLTVAQIKKALGEDVMHFWLNDEEYTLPIDMVLEVLYVWENHALEILNNLNRHIKNIKDLDNGEAIEAYDYTTDYPEPLVIKYGLNETPEEPVEPENPAEEETPEIPEETPETPETPEDTTGGSSNKPWWWEIITGGR